METMEHKILVPEAGESIVEAIVADWHVKEQQECKEGDVLVELETDKITLEVTAPKDGILIQIKSQTGEKVNVGDTIALFKEIKIKENKSSNTAPAPEKELSQPIPTHSVIQQETQGSRESNQELNTKLAPGAQAYAQEHKIDPTLVKGTGKREQVRKTDLVNYTHQNSFTKPSAPSMHQDEEIVPMSPLRKRIAERLLFAQRTAAILTTFNEIDMQATINLRKKYKEPFQGKIWC